MPYENIPFKSYCWSLGTTSFRTKQFNQKLEQQLKLLQDFFEVEENKNEDWNGNKPLQTRYYDFLKEKEFIKGNAPNKDKDSREKTSGLCELGLIDDNRRLTEVGLKLLELSKNCDFSKSNILKIPKDSFVFTKQLLKLSNTQVDDNIVRPYLVLIYLLSKLEYLTNEEFTYLLPLCVSKNTTLDIIDSIKHLRNRETTIDKIILDTVLALPNYSHAKRLFLQNFVSEELICTIGMNRKSRNYDKPYCQLYIILKEICVNKNYSKAYDLYESTKFLKLKTYWRKYLFVSTNRNKLKNTPQESLSQAKIFKVCNEDEFKNIFFDMLHLFKIKANLSDYSDLNERYFKITDTVIFEDNKVHFDIIPKYYFKNLADQLFGEAFSLGDLLHKDCDISEISSCFDIDINSIYQEIQNDLEIPLVDESNISQILSDERIKRFKKLIDEKFSDETLVELLTYFENRNDDKIFGFVTDNATIPTIFEYILGIIWYKISDYTGNILDFMNLSLEADLLPKTHACGGDADIVYEYERTAYYPKHSMLIEATLMDESTQRRGEMEPVSRHLGNYILNTNNKAYCTFISPYLDINVLNHFRSLKSCGYYNPQNSNQHVESLKIVPLKTKELKTIIKKGTKYKDIYNIFDNAYTSNTQLPKWYETDIAANL
jgi:hypothetical protein